MGWEEDLFAVFDDLEHQAESLFAAEREIEVADLGRAEYHQVTLASRLMASMDAEVALDLLGAGLVRGTIERVGTQWCLLRGHRQDWVVRLAAVRAVHDASPRSVPEIAWSPVQRLGFGSALRRLAEAGEHCLVHEVDGSRHEVTPRRVGSDFVEGVGSRGQSVLLPFATIAAVQSRE